MQKSNLEILSDYSIAIIRFRNGKIVEHWGGPHCQDGIGIKVDNPHQL